jgi:hypothetical protein
MQTAAAGEKPGAGRHSCHSCFVYTRIEIVVYSLTTAGASTTRLLLPVSISPGKRSPYRSCRLARKSGNAGRGLCWELREDWRMRTLRVDSSGFPLSLILLVSFSRPFNNVLYTAPSFFVRSPHSAQLRKLSIRPAGTLRVDRSNSSDT